MPGEPLSPADFKNAKELSKCNKKFKNKKMKVECNQSEY